jgi:FkbM family methyltransferase
MTATPSPSRSRGPRAGSAESLGRRTAPPSDCPSEVPVLHRLARVIRHLPGLEQAEWLWTVLRKPYHWALDPWGRGILILAGGIAPIRVPTEFVGGSWDTFEPETVRVFAAWIREHPGARVLDVGSSIGLYSAVALFAGTDVEVIAFDSDLASLAALKRLCRHADQRRLRVVHGLLGQTATRIESVENAASATQRELDVHPKSSSTRYICLDPNGRSPDEAAIPCRRLDDLLPVDDDGMHDLLIKCDVEGAELHVLMGAEKLIERCHPNLLLSVHPEALPHYGHSKQVVSDCLRRFGYDVTCLAIDHEEHWWCTYASH